MRFLLSVIFLILTSGLLAQSDLEQIHQEITQDGIRGHLEFLASDELKGRNTGTEGLEIAAIYAAGQFRSFGLKPAYPSYQQGVPFSTFSPPDSSSFQIGNNELSFPDDFIVINGRQEAMTGETVNIGYGTEEELKGLDLQSKIAVSTAGDGISEDPRDWIGESRAKRKRVKEAGAVALIEIYQSPQIPWRFLKMLGTQSQTSLDQGYEISDLPNIWIGTEDIEVLSDLRGGELPVTFYMDEVKREQFTSANVVAMIEGTDPELANEYIIYSAHYDHVGEGNPDETGDTIYNGARDNAVGTTAILSLAEYFGKYPPKRSSIFVLFTAEEKGLLGSRYFSQNMPVEAKDVIYNLNIDNGGYNDTTIVTVIGLTRTEAEEDFQAACGQLGLTAIEDAAKEQGLFDRSDNVNFAVLGIPAPTFSLGFRSFDAEIFKYYHQPGDEVETLNLNYIEKYTKAYILSAIKIANSEKAPFFWNEGDKYYEQGKTLYDMEPK